jgi:hypothetical protein
MKEDPNGYAPQYMYHVADEGNVDVEIKTMPAAEHWPLSPFKLLSAVSDGAR